MLAKYNLIIKKINLSWIIKLIKSNLPRGPRDVKPVEINTADDEAKVSESSVICEAGRL